MKMRKRLHLHSRNIPAHNPFPVAEQIDHSPSDVRIVGDDVRPVAREWAETVLVEKVQKGRGHKQAAHGRPAWSAAKCILEIVKVQGRN